MPGRNLREPRQRRRGRVRGSDRDSQRYFAKVGLARTTTDREGSICSQTVATDAPLVVLVWRDSPLVRGEPHIRFYAGAPIRVEGQPIGTFCIIDADPTFQSA